MSLRCGRQEGERKRGEEGKVTLSRLTGDGNLGGKCGQGEIPGGRWLENFYEPECHI